ncbi:hypothetical protein R1flu_015960 [Riccia fluitans]|uniref:Uncharacterized protein n=1 Tax=Riccia fluitans TaxID=41844 RepID=A0ABD1YLH4_9MARC
MFYITPKVEDKGSSTRLAIHVELHSHPVGRAIPQAYKDEVDSAVREVTENSPRAKAGVVKIQATKKIIERFLGFEGQFPLKKRWSCGPQWLHLQIQIPLKISYVISQEII